MKNKIQEVQNYFINKITACDFQLQKLDFQKDNWFKIELTVDGYEFSISICRDLNICCVHSIGSFIQIDIPNDRLYNLIQLAESKIKESRLAKIESLKSEIEKLQTA